MTESPSPPAGAAGGRRYELRGSVEPLLVDEELYLLRAGAEDLIVRDADRLDVSLVDVLARDALTAEEVGTRLGLEADVVRAKLDALDVAGVLAPGATSAPLDPHDASRFSRQLPYLAEYGDKRDLQRRIMSARVAVLGCGGLGTWTIATLAAAGVRQFVLCDDDAVELSNLNRQAMFRADQIGRSKVEVAREWLRAFDSRIEADVVAARVDGVSTARSLVRDADALVFTADHPPYELARWVNAACVAARVPFIAGGQVPPVIRIGPLYVPGATACYACHETALRSESIAYDRYVAQAQRAPVRSATLGPASATVGSMLAMELVHLIVGIEPATLGTALSLDLRALEIRHDAVPPDDGCGVCGSL